MIVQFDLSTNVMQAAQDVRDKVALIRPDLRDGVKEPRVLRYDPADMPIVTVAVSNARGSALSTRDLTTAADQIVRKRLETVRGVGSVSIVGGVKRQVRIDVSPDKAAGAFGWRGSGDPCRAERKIRRFRRGR